MVELVCRGKVFSACPLASGAGFHGFSQLLLLYLPEAIFPRVYGCSDIPLEKSAGIGLEPSLVSMPSLVWYIC